MWVVLSLDQLGQLVVLQLKGRRRKEPYYLCADSPLQDSTHGILPMHVKSPGTRLRRTSSILCLDVLRRAGSSALCGYFLWLWNRI